MNEAFWKGFRDGFVTGSKYGIPFLLGAFVVDIFHDMNTHPYDECVTMYETPEDIMECVWIKENP